MNPRFPESTAKRLKEAAAIRGQSIAEFILEVVSREAAASSKKRGIGT